MKILQKDDTVSSMEYSQQLLDSEDKKQAETGVQIQLQLHIPVCLKFIFR